MVLFDPEYESTDHPRPIFARSGWKIPQPPPSEVEEAQKDLGDVRDDTRRLRELIRPVKRQSLSIRSVSQHLYSCVGMIFSNRRAWIDPDSLYRILTEDGYTKLIDGDRLSIGDLALYVLREKPVHIGVVTQVSKANGGIIDTRVLSKWGRAGEVEHSVNDVPDFCGRLHSYWSERVPEDVSTPH